MTDFTSIVESLIAGDEAGLTKLVREALGNQIPAQAILNDGLMVGMDIIGEKMQSGDMFIPEVLMAAKCMGAAVEILKPLLGEDATNGVGKVIIGTVKGDLHDIGKNLVMMMMKSAGFEIADLGVDIAPEKFVSAVKEQQADIVALSALLTTTMPMMKQTIDAIIDSGLRDEIKIIIGGAPVTRKFAEEIGADGYAPDAGSASKLAKNLINYRGDAEPASKQNRSPIHRICCET